MARENIVRVRLNDKEFSHLKAEAERRDVAISEVLRDFVKLLTQEEAKSA